MRLSHHLYREIFTATGLLVAAVLGLAWWGVVHALDAQAWARASEAADRVTLALDGETEAASRVGATLEAWWRAGALRVDAPETLDAVALPLLSEQTFISSVNFCAVDGTSVLLLRLGGEWHSRALRRRLDGGEQRWTRRRAGVVSVDPWEPTDYDPRTRDWYQGALSATGPRWSPQAYRFMTTKDPGITLALPVRRAGATEGVIAVDVLLDDLSSHVWQVQPTPGTRVAVADPQGRALLLPHLPATEARADRLAHFLQPVGASLAPELGPLAADLGDVPPEGRRLVTHADGAAFYGLVRPYRGPAGLTWYVMVAIPEAEILGPSRGRALAVLVVAVLGLGVLLWRARAIARRFGRPLDTLAGAPEDGAALPPLPLEDALRRVRHAAREHSTLLEQVHHGQRRETVALLAGGVAHDVNNQLTIVLGQLEPALEALGPAHPASDDLALARQAALRCAEMTRALLAYSRGAPRQAAGPVDLERLVREVAALVGRVLGPRLSLGLELAPDLPPVHGHAFQLEQALVNLLLNARDAMPAGGAITLRAAPEGEGAVRLEVSDTGAGMGPEVLARIFEPYFSTKAPGRGTGLGLPMVKHIVEDHGGRVEVVSALGRGTTFTLHLPAVPRAAQAGAA